MSERTCVDLTIIGGGPCGLFASFYAGLRGMSVRIIDSLPELGGQLVALYPEKYIYDMPGFPKALAKDLAAEMIIQGTQFSPELALGTTAETLAETEFGYVITDEKGQAFPTKTIIIAAGAGAFSPTKIGLAKEADYEGRGLTYGVRDPKSFAGKRVGILGGGDSAFDWCLALEPLAASVCLIHRRDQFRAHEDSVAKVRALDIPMHLFQVVTDIHGDEHLSAITLENTQDKSHSRLELDALVVNIGYKSSLGPLSDWGLEIVKNQIVVDPTSYETQKPGVFAVGDVCTFPGKLKLIATGVGEAVTAVCVAKTRLNPEAKLFPGHSSDRDLS